jgi:hypothetical protein
MVLDGDDRVAQSRGDLVETNDEAVLEAVQFVHDVASRVVDHGGLGELGGRVLAELGQLCGDPGVDVAEEGEKGDNAEQKDRDEPDERDPQCSPRPAMLLPPLVPPTPATAHPGEPCEVHGAAITQKKV